MEKIVIIGGGDYAKKVIKLIKKDYSCDIIGYTDNSNKGSLFDIKYLGNDTVLKRIKQQQPKLGAVLCIAGNIRQLENRKNIISILTNLNILLPVIKASSSFIDESVEIGKGVVIFDCAYIDFGVKIGDYSIVNLNATLCHDSSIGKNVVISPKAVTGGGSVIGDNCFIGMNSTINPYIKITCDVIIGSGAVVTKDCCKKGTYVGNPAKKIK